MHLFLGQTARVRGTGIIVAFHIGRRLPEGAEGTMARNGRTKPPTFTQLSLGEDYHDVVDTDGSFVVWMGTAL
jgi:hypothetical protein